MKKFFELVEKEIESAKKKHPKFCDKMLPPLLSFGHLEKAIKKQNSKGPYFGYHILTEEIFEAMNAYENEEFDHCVQELAQVCAVAFRMVEQISKESRAKCRKKRE